MKLSENQLDNYDKMNAVDNALDDIGLEVTDISDSIKREAKEANIKLETGKLDAPKPIKEIVITDNDRQHAVDKRLVPEHYRNVRFDEHSIKENLKIQHKRSRGLYRVFHFNDYMQTCNEILTTLRMGILPRRSWIIGAPNGFGKTSFVNECLITMLKQGWVCAPYISLHELAGIRVAEEQRLMKPFCYKATTSYYNNEYGDYISEKQNYLYKEGIAPRDIIKNPLIIQSAYSWSEYINAKCLFVSFTDVVSKDLESHVLYQLLSIRGAKGLPTIAMISTSLDPYVRDVELRELVWNEILDYNEDKDSYDRIKHVSCYKQKQLDFNKDDKADKDTGILN